MLTKGFFFAEIAFPDLMIDKQTGEVQLPVSDVTAELRRKFNRAELRQLADRCRDRLNSGEGPTAILFGERRPFAEFLMEQATLAMRSPAAASLGFQK